MAQIRSIPRVSSFTLFCTKSDFKVRNFPSQSSPLSLWQWTKSPYTQIHRAILLALLWWFCFAWTACFAVMSNHWRTLRAAGYVSVLMTWTAFVVVKSQAMKVQVIYCVVTRCSLFVLKCFLRLKACILIYFAEQVSLFEAWYPLRLKVPKNLYQMSWFYPTFIVLNK